MIGMRIKPSDLCITRRPGVIGLPLIGAGLKTGGLGKTTVADPFEPVIEPSFLQFLERSGRIALKSDLPQTVGPIVRPLPMTPRTQHQIIAVKGIRSLKLCIHDLRPIEIFLIIITAYEQRGYL